MPDRSRTRTGRVVLATTARRAIRSGAVYGVLFGVLVANEALGYHKSFPDQASRTAFARSFGGNGALTAITGPARQLSTIGGFVAWRMFCLMIVVSALWGLFTSTRLLRGEEDSGRWELELSGRVTRRSACAQALVGLAAGLLAMWVLTSAFIVAAGRASSVGFTPAAGVFYGLAGCASGAIFLAVGAVTSQLASTRRLANGLAAVVFGLSYLVRMIADSRPELSGLRWASPLGWVENLAPLTASQPWALVPIAAFVAACAGLAVTLAGRRDVGVGLLSRDRRVPSRTVALGSAWAFALRLEGWVTVAWVAGMAALALVFGLVARAAASAGLGGNGVEQTVGRLGGTGSGAAAWIGYEFLFIAAIIAFAAAAQVAAARHEEAEGHLDNLLARPVSRRSWLAGRLAAGLLLVTGAALAAALGGWAALLGSDAFGPGLMLEAALNIAMPALLVLGLGVLLYGLAPRLDVPALNLLIAWSFLVQLVGSTLTTNRLLLDTAVLSHLRPVPAAAPDWAALAWLGALAVVAAALGFVTFDRRDLAAA